MRAMSSAPRSRSRSAAPPRARSDELVEIAAKLFLERGYDATTMQEIADEMGILKGSVYHYVRTKEDLLWMIVEPRFTELVNNARAIVEQHDRPVLERVRLALEAHAHSYDVHYPYMFVTTREDGSTISPKRQRRFEDLQHEYYQLWKDMIEEGVVNGELRSDLDTSTVVHAMFGMLNWMFRWFRQDGPMSAEDVGGTFASIAAAGLTTQSRTDGAGDRPRAS
jgi:AcrR family transcriptional regulator